VRFTGPMDAITLRTGVAVVSYTLANGAQEAWSVSPEPLAPIVFSPPPMPTVEEQALAIANERFGKAGSPFEVFSDQSVGSTRAVFVRRSTGDCDGGCVALAIAVVFREDGVTAHELDQIERFGPEKIQLLEVERHLVIAVDESSAMDGTTRTYRRYYVVKNEIEKQLCLEIAGSDRKGNAWKASNWIAAEGTMYFTGHYTTGGDKGPSMLGYSFPFDHGWKSDEEGCIEPRSKDL